MSRIVVRWYNESQNVVIQEYRTEWDWDELTDAMKAGFELIAKGNKPGALIVDMDYPDAIKDIQAGSYGRFQAIRAYTPNNLALIVVIGASPVMQSLARIFMSAVQSRVRVEFVTSLADADELLSGFYGQSA